MFETLQPQLVRMLNPGLAWRVDPFEVLRRGMATEAPVRERMPQERLFRPPVTVWEDDAAYHIELDVPGVSEGDISLSYESGVLTIGFERKMPEVPGLRMNERVFGRFERALQLPEDIDADRIDAELANGVLHVTVPKHASAQSIRVKVRRSNGNA
ncbi:MAG: Hsp20/alpha crystallin family protein [Planctomycetota bacterium]|nr:MAG: Hsp20/alpha crystallin family protein [Planctomycetota bacterium]